MPVPTAVTVTAITLLGLTRRHETQSRNSTSSFAMSILIVFSLKILEFVIIRQRNTNTTLGQHVCLYLVHVLCHLLLVELGSLNALVVRLTTGSELALTETVSEELLYEICVPCLITRVLVERFGDVSAPHMEQRVLVEGAWLLLLPLRFGLDGHNIVTIREPCAALVECTLVTDLAVFLTDMYYHQ